MKSIHETIIMYFSSIVHHIICHVAKLETRILLVRGEIKKKERNLSKGLIGAIELVWGSKFSLNFIQGVEWTKWIGEGSKMDFFFFAF